MRHSASDQYENQLTIRRTPSGHSITNGGYSSKVSIRGRTSYNTKGKGPIGSEIRARYASGQR